MSTHETLSKWHLSEQDARDLYSQYKAIMPDIERMVTYRYAVARILESRGIPFSSLDLHNDTPYLDRAISGVVYGF